MDEFLEWYNNHKGYLIKFLRSYIHVNGSFKNELEVDDTIKDVIQEMFLTIYERKYNPKNIAGLIITITKNNAIKELRRKKQWGTISLEVLKNENKKNKYKKYYEVQSNFPLFKFPSQEKYSEKNELQRILKKEINKFSRDKKNYQIFSLRMKGYEYNEIAEITKLKRAVCIDRMYFIKNKLKKDPIIRNYHNSWIVTNRNL